MKKLLALLALCAVGINADPRINQILTIASGTPIHLSAFHFYVSRILIQAAESASGGIIQICTGIPIETTPAANCGTAGQLGGQLAAATSTAPGGSYSDTSDNHQGKGIDLATIWIDGAHTGDTVIVSYVQQN